MSDMYKSIESALNKKTVNLKPPYPLMFFYALLSQAAAKLKRSVPTLTLYNLRYIKKYPVCRISMEKASRDFGYRTHIPLKKGVELTARWYKENGHL